MTIPVCGTVTTLDLYKSFAVKERDRKAAIIDNLGKTTYAQLKLKSDAISRGLKQQLPSGNTTANHVSLLCGNNSAYVQV